MSEEGNMSQSSRNNLEKEEGTRRIRTIFILLALLPTSSSRVQLITKTAKEATTITRILLLI